MSALRAKKTAKTAKKASKGTGGGSAATSALDCDWDEPLAAADMVPGLGVSAERKGGAFEAAVVEKRSKKEGLWAVRFADGKLLPKAPRQMRRRSIGSGGSGGSGGSVSSSSGSGGSRNSDSSRRAEPAPAGKKRKRKPNHLHVLPATTSSASAASSSRPRSESIDDIFSDGKAKKRELEEEAARRKKKDEARRRREEEQAAAARAKRQQKDGDGKAFRFDDDGMKLYSMENLTDMGKGGGTDLCFKPHFTDIPNSMHTECGVGPAAGSPVREVCVSKRHICVSF